MTTEHQDEKAIVKDFKESFENELKALGKEEQEQALEKFEQHFQRGFAHVKARRHALGDKQSVLRHIHEAKININYARKNDVEKHFPDYTDNLGYGLGILMAIIEYGCFRNQWKEEANIISEHLTSTIKLLDRATHEHHHKKIRKRVKHIIRSKETTQEEQQLGAAVLDAFK